MACVVEGCKSHITRKENTTEFVSFHRFPKGEIIKNEWTRWLARHNWTPKIRSLCSNHFTSESFVPNESVRWRRLKANAVHTLYLPDETNSVELHAHLNGSLSRSTILELRRYYADAGIVDKTNVFYDEFEIGSGDTRNLLELVFAIAHSLTTTPKALAMATSFTLKEFEDDGCCYIELRSTPRDTQYMTKKQYIDTVVQTIKKCSADLKIISRYIISINRNSSPSEAENISDLAIEYYKSHPDVVVGIELSGDPTVGNFHNFKPALMKAKEAGLKISLHCGEVCNTSEIIEMLEFKPDRIGHAVHVHPRFGGTSETWSALCSSKIPVEICLTSNVNTKSVADYDSHHFQEFYDADVPIVICTDDKGVFATCLSQEYKLCAETFKLNKSQLAHLAMKASQYIFATDVSEVLKDKLQFFINKHSL